MQSTIKIIIDVNLWVSAIISKRAAMKIQEILLQDDIEIIVCEELLEELERTLQKPKLQKYVTLERTRTALELIKQSTTLLIPESKVELCRDNKDNYLLALAKDAHVECLLTGDKDLLILKTFESAQIMSLVDFTVNYL